MTMRGSGSLLAAVPPRHLTQPRAIHQARHPTRRQSPRGAVVRPTYRSHHTHHPHRSSGTSRSGSASVGWRNQRRRRFVPATCPWSGGCSSCACWFSIPWLTVKAGVRSAPPECCIVGADGQPWLCGSAPLVAFQSSLSVRLDRRLVSAASLERGRASTTVSGSCCSCDSQVSTGPPAPGTTRSKRL